MFKLVKVFKVRIVYKSGHTEEFEVTEFSVSGNTYSWNTYNKHKGRKYPLVIGADDIAAVWQLGCRTVLKW